MRREWFKNKEKREGDSVPPTHVIETQESQCYNNLNRTIIMVDVEDDYAKYVCN